MLAGMALMLATAILYKMGKTKYTWVTVLPATFVFNSNYVWWNSKSVTFQRG